MVSLSIEGFHICGMGFSNIICHSGIHPLATDHCDCFAKGRSLVNSCLVF